MTQYDTPKLVKLCEVQFIIWVGLKGLAAPRTT